MPTRIAVLASGGGSNLQALLDHWDTLGASPPGTIALVASDRPGAGALARARERGIPALALDQAQRTDGMAELLRAHHVDLVVLAGYLRFIPLEVTQAWRGRLVNVHPALLPAFGGPGMYGHHVHEAVIARGARVSGATVHFVDEEYDHGPIIAQWPVPVYASDSAATLAARVLAVEHLVYPQVVQRLCDGRITLDADGRVRGAYTDLVAPHFALAASPAAAAIALKGVLA